MNNIGTPRSDSALDNPYWPLKPGHIRLLHLYPGSKDDPLQCSLHTVELERHANKYQAVSYEWGHREDVGGAMNIANLPHPKQLQRNLEVALREIRLPDKDLVLWIDTLCINQDDLQEKSQQVTMMGAIFKHARHVIAWIGPARDDSDIAMDRIKQFERDIDNHNLKETEIQLIQALATLVNRSYWSRVWIVQELFLAKDFEVRCGTKTTNRDAFYEFLAYMDRESSQFSDSKWRALVKTNPAIIHKHGYYIPGANTLAVWMRRCLVHSFHAMNPRDYVYALIGIANDVRPGEIVPDYEDSQESLRWAFYQASRGRVGNGKLMGFCGRSSYERVAAKMGVKTDGELAWEQRVGSTRRLSN